MDTHSAETLTTMEDQTSDQLTSTSDIRKYFTTDCDNTPDSDGAIPSGSGVITRSKAALNIDDLLSQSNPVSITIRKNARVKRLQQNKSKKNLKSSLFPLTKNKHTDNSASTSTEPPVGTDMPAAGAGRPTLEGPVADPGCGGSSTTETPVGEALASGTGLRADEIEMLKAENRSLNNQIDLLNEEIERYRKMCSTSKTEVKKLKNENDNLRRNNRTKQHVKQQDCASS